MQADQAHQTLPDWLPMSVARYVAHTEQGVSIRELARRDGCHASTVMRQIRKLETMRDDPLVDDALNKFRKTSRDARGNRSLMESFEAKDMPQEQELRREAIRVLRRLRERGAVLAVAKDMEKAVVVRDGVTRTAVVARHIAQAMALKGWISCTQSGRISRYAITPVGRTTLSQFLAEVENTTAGFAETQAQFGDPNVVLGKGRLTAHRLAEQGRFIVTESPLAGLARRRDKDGKPFLDDGRVAAGERLREDFELAQMGGVSSPNWERFLKAPSKSEYRPDVDIGVGQEAARQRVADVVAYLGDGLCDVALRCCCYLEGLETAERRLGWSARSGKVVLRIALGRLRDYYKANAGGSGDYIG